MAKKSVRRVRRSGRVSREQAARDEQVRREVRAEFPPRRAEPLGASLSEALKAAVRGSELTAYEIAKRAGISQIMISRFLSGERDIRLATADKLAGALGLKLIPV